jgi:predicted metal-dependent hydrolase
MIRTYRDIRYRLQRAERKTASIYVERNGEVLVIAPSELSKVQIEKVLEDKRRWIYRSLAEWQDLNSTRVKRQFVNGEGFLYLGRSYRLKLVPQQSDPLVLKDGYFCLQSSLRKTPLAKEAFREFYREKCLGKISERVEFYQKSIDVEPKSIRVIDLQNRWASCTPAGRLNFHWKCVMAPMKIIDYIVVHELSHLIHADHSNRFWNEVDKLLPDFLERKEWLRVHGASLDL